MAGPYNPPVKNQAWSTRISLQDMTVVGSLKANPTLASGDWKVDIDGGGFNNLGTLPTVSPASGVAVLLSLSAAEMNGDVITITGIDQTSPKEWADYFLCINTTAAGASVNVTQWAGSNVATPNTAGVPIVDTKYVSGTTQTARDLGASVLLSNGTGTGQISLASGAVTVGTNNDKTAYALTSAYDFSKGTVAMTESYAALHSAPTAIQALFGILQVLNERNLSGTTLTIKKVDGSTTAETFTLDSATTPTTQTRAT